jgi:hypothetical protein
MSYLSHYDIMTHAHFDTWHHNKISKACRANEMTHDSKLWVWLNLEDFRESPRANQPWLLRVTSGKSKSRVSARETTRRQPDQVERGRVSGRDMLEENVLVKEWREHKDRSPWVIVGEKQVDMSASRSLEDAWGSCMRWAKMQCVYVWLLNLFPSSSHLFLTSISGPCTGMVI